MSGLHFFSGPKHGILLQSKIITYHTGETHFALFEPNSLAQSLYIIVAETIDADLIPNLRVQFWNRQYVSINLGRQQFPVRWKVDAHVTWVADRWISHDHVDLLGTSVAQRTNDRLATCSQHYAVVDADDVLHIDYGSDGYDLPGDLFPTLIGRLDEASETSFPP